MCNVSTNDAVLIVHQWLTRREGKNFLLSHSVRCVGKMLKSFLLKQARINTKNSTSPVSTIIVPQCSTTGVGQGCSSVGRASDPHAADADSIPWGRKFFFLPGSTFSADSLLMSVHHRLRSHALTAVHTFKILHSISEFGGLWKL